MEIGSGWGVLLSLCKHPLMFWLLVQKRRKAMLFTRGIVYTHTQHCRSRKNRCTKETHSPHLVWILYWFDGKGIDCETTGEVYRYEHCIGHSVCLSHEKTQSPATLKRKVKVAQSCPTLWDPRDYTVHGILQARILQWITFPFSRGSPQPRDRTQVSLIAGRFFASWATREAQEHWSG